MVAYSREYLEGVPNAEVHLNDGRSLGMIADGSVDFVWSFDVFVHIRAEQVRGYVREFARVLAPGGRAVIHHSRAGVNFGWRSDMTAEKMQTFADEAGLELVDQLVEWDDGRHWLWPDLPSGEGPDVISVLGKPGPSGSPATPASRTDAV